MRYDERFTDRLCFPEDDIEDKVTYLARVDESVILTRLGQYEDLGFSPAELVDILLELKHLNTDHMELLKIAKKRIELFDQTKY